MRLGSGEAAADPEAQLLADPDPFNSSSFTNLPPPVHSTPAPPPPRAPPSMTEEQRERMEQNRRRALERRLTRQQQQPCGERTSNDGDARLHPHQFRILQQHQTVTITFNSVCSDWSFDNHLGHVTDHVTQVDFSDSAM